MRILLIEDERKVARFLQRGLEAEHHSVDIAYDGEEGLARLCNGPYDLVILDVMLPQRDGLAVLHAARQRGVQTPILLLTARDTLADKVAGLDQGADDYLTKPFAFEELLARLRALLRRSATAQPTILALADLRLDPAARQVTRAGKRIDLTAKEFALLEFFLRNPGRVLSRALIAQHVWGVDFDTFTNVIDVYVKYLRKKIDAEFEPKLIHTVRGAGYVLKETEP
ncbi:MAG TPA: response regulator transcription factor [Methylomirabilota bacterium]|jgi:heavy metal response regulator|nr:response regulator transcription factor [Methylomirabilota bacterium]